MAAPHLTWNGLPSTLILLIEYDSIVKKVDAAATTWGSRGSSSKAKGTGMMFYLSDKQKLKL